MRYRGQGHEIAVPLPTRPYRDDDAANLRAPFEEAYRRLYSRIIPGVEVEILSWVLLLSAPPPAETAAPPPAPPAYAPEPARRRPVFDPESGEFVTVAIHDRRDLSPAPKSPAPRSSSKTKPRPSLPASSTRRSTPSAISN